MHSECIRKCYTDSIADIDQIEAWTKQVGGIERQTCHQQSD
jgi:hypothetical protein